MTLVARTHTVHVTATAADLPPDVAAALAAPKPPEHRVVDSAGIAWSILSWGDPAGSPVLLVHGVTSEAMNYWRIGPAIAATGRHVLAVDLPGHGATGQWQGRHRHIETAADLAELIHAIGFANEDLDVVGHSWGGMVVANLPAAGIRPRTLVLLDPPHLTLPELEALTRDPTERRYDTFDEARRVVRETQPSYADGDVDAKAMALTRFDVDAVRSILVENGDWDAGLNALASPVAAGISVWLIRGEWTTGGLIPEDALPALAARLGPEHVMTITGGPHSPMRTHPEATTLAILRALDGSVEAGVA